MPLDLKRALAAYVSGRNRGWDSELKSPPAEGESISRTSDSGSAGNVGGPAGTVPAPDVGAVPPGGRAAPPFGVSVPQRLAFERGPGTWRRRLPEAPHD